MPAQLPAPLPIAFESPRVPVLTDGVARDLASDPVTGELVVDGGDLVIVRGVSSIRQDVEQRLRFFRGEWFLDLDVGVDYFGRVLGKTTANNTAAIEELRTCIRGTLGVRSITSLTLRLDRVTREAVVEWSADTDLGALTNQTTRITT